MNKDQFQFIVISVIGFLLVVSAYRDGGLLGILEEVIVATLAISLIILVELLGEQFDD
jgi:hypothetical protein